MLFAGWDLLGPSSGSSLYARVPVWRDTALRPRSPGPWRRRPLTCGSEVCLGNWVAPAPASPGTLPLRVSTVAELSFRPFPVHRVFVLFLLSRMISHPHLWAWECLGLNVPFSALFTQQPWGCFLPFISSFPCDSQGTQPSNCDDYCPHQIMSWEHGDQSPALNA